MGVKNVMFSIYITTPPFIPSRPGRGNLNIATLKLALMALTGEGGGGEGLKFRRQHPIDKYIVDFASLSHVEPEGDDVTVFDDIIFSLQPEFAVGFGAGKRIPAGHEVIITHYFRLDKSPLKILMDGPRSFRGL